MSRHADRKPWPPQGDLDAAKHPAWTLDLAGNVMGVNQAFLAAFGYSPGEVLGRHQAEFLSGAPVREPVVGETSTTAELLDASGFTQPVRLVTAGLPDDGGAVFGYLETLILDARAGSGTSLGLRAAVDRITEPLDLQEVLHAAGAGLKEWVGFERAAVVLESETPRFVEIFPLSNGEASRDRLAKRPAADQVFRSARPLNLTPLDDLFSPHEFSEPAALLLPLRNLGAVAGVLVLESKQPYDNVSAARASLFAVALAGALNRAKLFASEQIRREISLRLLEEFEAEQTRMRRVAEELQERLRDLERRAGAAPPHSPEAGLDEIQLALVQSQSLASELQEANLRLVDRERELIARNQALERETLSRYEFLANMSHELRTPLNAIMGFSEILQDQIFGPLSERQAKYVANIHVSGQEILRLLDDILAQFQYWLTGPSGAERPADGPDGQAGAPGGS
jgi:PAS domain S-box-containing protein